MIWAIPWIQQALHTSVTVYCHLLLVLFINNLVKETLSVFWLSVTLTLISYKMINLSSTQLPYMNKLIPNKYVLISKRPGQSQTSLRPSVDRPSCKHESGVQLQATSKLAVQAELERNPGFDFADQNWNNQNHDTPINEQKVHCGFCFMSWRLQSLRPLGDGAAVVHQTISKVSDSSKSAVREAAARKSS